MAKRRRLKIFYIRNTVGSNPTPRINFMKIETILKQIIVHQKMFSWIIKETEKIFKKIVDLETKQFDAKKYEKLRDMLIELQLRYQQDRIQYQKSFKLLKKTFKENYGINIVALLESDIGAK